MNTPSTCPHFSECSGCEIDDYLHPSVWREALQFFHEKNIRAELITDGFIKTRSRAKLAVRKGPKIGLFKSRSHEVLPIPHCLVHHASINEARDILEREMILQKIEPYQENPISGSLRYAQFFVHRETGKVQLTLVSFKEIEAFAESLKKYDLFHSIWMNLQKEPTNRIFGDVWKLISGEPFLWQRINGRAFPFHPGAFSQAHLPLFEKMIQKIESWTEEGDRMIELYAGIGVIGLSLEKKATSLTLVENNPYAHLSFQQMKTSANYQCIDAAKADLNGYDLTIVDPPRKGLDPEIIPKINSSRLIYVSCNFSSFKRDADLLISLGWKIKEANGYLLFPGTNHVEIVALFTPVALKKDIGDRHVVF